MVAASIIMSCSSPFFLDNGHVSIDWSWERKGESHVYLFGPANLLLLEGFQIIICNYGLRLINFTVLSVMCNFHGLLYFRSHLYWTHWANLFDQKINFHVLCTCWACCIEIYMYMCMWISLSHRLWLWYAGVFIFVQCIYLLAFFFYLCS